MKDKKEQRCDKSIFNKPNIVSSIRVLILFIAVYLVLSNYSILAAATIVVIFLLDFVDGCIARRFKEETEFGKVLDEIVDRLVENILFIVFAYVGYIPLWVPIVMVTRGIVVDNILLYFGRPETKRYMHLVRSNISRGSYGFLKMLLFVALVFYPSSNTAFQTAVLFLTIVVVVFSLFRGFVKLREICWHKSAQCSKYLNL
ncbi:MAG: CDP-alcohol phosphatidyltransferase family protein [Candidatus Micrarchaeia archaeon]